MGVFFGFFDYTYLIAIPNRILGIMTNQNLLAVPLFIFMGLILEKTKIAEELLLSMNTIYKNLKDLDGDFMKCLSGSKTKLAIISRYLPLHLR